MLNKKALAGSVSAPPAIYPEDVFSTYLYTGNGSTQTITNGIDLSGKGGLVWLKDRGANNWGHSLFDTARGAGNRLISSSTAAQSTGFSQTFTTSGFDLDGNANYNWSGDDFVSWTWRKQPKYFDIQTWTGTGSNTTISHSLGSVPACIMVKRTDTTGAWQVYHRSLANTEYLVLNTTALKATGATRWNSTTPTSTEFSIGTDATVNASGGTYVAYIFAHDAGGFGLTGTDNVISCGSFNVDSSGNASVNLGWEPQWVLFKDIVNTQQWFILDNMRGFPTSVSSGPDARQLIPNSATGESGYGQVGPTSTGFNTTQGQFNANATYIYMAIRRPMKTPTSGTQVFYANAVSQANSPDSSNVPFPPDLINTFSRDGTNRSNNFSYFQFVDRLRGAGTPNNTRVAASEGRGLVSSGTNAEYGTSAPFTYVQLKANSQDITRGTGWNSTDYGNWIYYFLRRASGFFDIVCYTGNQTARTINHNLGVAPELMITKDRSGGGFDAWLTCVPSIGMNNILSLNTNGAIDTGWSSPFTSTSPTSSVFSLSSGQQRNETGVTYVAYLFATLAGVSKVGSYTGNGSSQTINCGFTAGARFVLIKRTDATGDWYVWDTARGIVSGNDPYLLLNSTAAEVTNTDYIDPVNSGFELSSTAPAAINANGGTFIFLAIA